VRRPFGKTDQGTARPEGFHLRQEVYASMTYAARMERWGGYSALLMAALFVASVSLTAWMPPLDEQSPIPFWPHLLFDYLFALMALLGLALIPAVHQRLQASSPLLTWSAGVAQVGFALTAIVSLWQADYETSLWREAASEASGSLGLLQGGWSGWLQLLLERMPRGWLETAGVGLWILVVSRIAHRLPVWPTSLTQSGLVLGAAMACIALGATTGFTFLQVFGLLNYLILWPFWLLRLGLFLLHPIPALAPSFAHMRRKAEALGRRLHLRRTPVARTPEPPQ